MSTRPLISATCLALPDPFTDGSEDLQVPEWIELIPPGKTIRGVDGREFVNPGAEELVNMFSRPIPVDVNHGSEVDIGSYDGRAIGWIEELEARDGSVWGRVDWSSEGKHIVSERMFRYVSPAFLMDGTTREIVKLTSAGVVNHPNFEQLAALNKNSDSIEDNSFMNVEVLKALGLSEDAVPEDAVTAIQSLKRADPERFVPRADYDLMKNRAETAEAEIKAEREAAFRAEVEDLVDAACKAGKIAPPSKSFYLDTCRTSEDLDRLRAFVNSAPEALRQEAPKSEPETGSKHSSLTENQKMICSKMGIDEEAYLETLKESE